MTGYVGPGVHPCLSPEISIKLQPINCEGIPINLDLLMVFLTDFTKDSEQKRLCLDSWRVGEVCPWICVLGFFYFYHARSPSNHLLGEYVWNFFQVLNKQI